MKEASFNDILTQKIKAQEEQQAPASPIKNEVPKIEFEFTAPIFFIQNDKIKVTSKKRYPHHVRVKKPEAPPLPPPPPPETIYSKAKLDADGQSKWNLFEKTFGVQFGEQVTQSTIRATFRKFAKSVHPDLNQEQKQHNFALLVKIRNELLTTLSK